MIRPTSLLRGVVAGGLATLLMSLPIATSIPSPAPPREVTARVARKTHLLPTPREPAFRFVWPLAHVGYGAAFGACFSLASERQPRPRPRPWVSGLLAGEALWAVGYLGLLPALRLYPTPDDDRSPRPFVMIVAHAIYGIALATIDDWLASRRPLGTKDA